MIQAIKIETIILKSFGMRFRNTAPYCQHGISFVQLFKVRYSSIARNPRNPIKSV